MFFTAHSLPLRVVGEGDPYPDQVAESAADVAALLGLDDDANLTWELAWQSAGRTEEPWIGPDLLASIRRVAEGGATSVVVCPVGFVSDHLEILYDLDIEAAALAHSLGLAFARTPSFNDDAAFLTVLASVVRQADADAQTDADAVRPLRRPTPPLERDPPEAADHCRSRRRHRRVGGSMGTGGRTGAGRDTRPRGARVRGRPSSGRQTPVR